MKYVKTFYKIILNKKFITKREELLFRVVLALPYASRTGFVETICSSKLGLFESLYIKITDLFLKSTKYKVYTSICCFLGALAAATKAKYWITFFVFSVLPAPDSPLK